MSNNTIHTTDKDRTPDNIVKTQHGGTTYTILEFMDGKEAVADIIARRVMRDLEPPFSIK